MKRYWRQLGWLLYTGIVGWLHFAPELKWWCLGILLSLLLLGLDRILYVWWLKPFEQLSIQVQYWWHRRDVVTVGRLLWERGHEQTKLVLNSMGFALVWPLLTLYVFTSTGSVTAMGIVMGLGLHLTLVLLQGLGNIKQLETWFCWQIKRPFSEKELRNIVYLFVGLFGLFTTALLVG